MSTEHRAPSAVERFYCAPRSVLCALLLLVAQDALAQARWFKGNTHTHTLKSDGDSPPADVVSWYRDRGYNFLVITDHDQVTEVESLADFLLIRGEEVTDHLGKKPLHVNGLGMREVVKPQGGSTIVETLQHDVDAIRAAGGLPAINHPNWGWAFGAAELKALKNVVLVEIASGHPLVNMSGGGGVPAVEAMWDDVLTSGVKMYAIGVDDAHAFQCGRTDPILAPPGKAWVVVRADSLTESAIIGAMERGDFYASTGVVLDDVVATPKSLTVKIKEQTGSRYSVEFIGHGGKVLKKTMDNPAEYSFRGGERYVRARVVDSNGFKAWVQPVFLRR